MRQRARVARRWAISHPLLRGCCGAGDQRSSWSGTSEYEYWVSVKAVDLRAALGVDAAVDLGEVLCVRAEEIVQAGESSWLTALGLEPTVRTWSSYPDD